MKFIALFLLLLNQGDVLIKQHGAEVPIGDVDSYIHDLPNEVRKKISYDNIQLEKDILGMLNMNIVYQYLIDSELIDKPFFKEIIQQSESNPPEVDQNYLHKLDLDSDKFKISYQKYNNKKALYKAFKDYIRKDIDRNKANKLAFDRFKVNQQNYVKPEMRDLSMIQLPQDAYSEDKVLTIIKELIANNSSEAFTAKAVKLSEDKTVNMNQGQLGLFKQSGFRYPFAENVFEARIGTVPAIFENKGNWYIVRVNEIVAAEQIPFEDVKNDLVETTIEHSMKRRFQAVISEYGQHEVEINNQMVDAVFHRYEVFQ